MLTHKHTQALSHNHKLLFLFAAALVAIVPSLLTSMFVLVTFAFVCVLCRHIAELIFYMEELRAHVRKYGPVMQRYYVQYLSGFDAVVLNELVQVHTATEHIHLQIETHI